MERPKHIFKQSVYKDKTLWGIYIAFIWVVFISIGLMDEQINSALGALNPLVFYGIIGLFSFMMILFVYCIPLGWCFIIAVFLVQTGSNIIRIFTTLADATLDGEHIIAMAKGSSGTALGIIMIVYLCQPFIRKIYTIGYKDKPQDKSI